MWAPTAWWPVPTACWSPVFDSGTIVENFRPPAAHCPRSATTIAGIRSSRQMILSPTKNGGVYFFGFWFRGISGQDLLPGRQRGRPRGRQRHSLRQRRWRFRRMVPRSMSLKTPTGKSADLRDQGPTGRWGAARDFIRLRDIVTADPSGAATPDSLRVDTHGNVFRRAIRRRRRGNRVANGHARYTRQCASRPSHQSRHQPGSKKPVCHSGR